MSLRSLRVQNEFDGQSQNLRTEAVSPILNKVGAVLASPVMRNVLVAMGGGPTHAA
jgi:hypothetical protein